MFRFREQFFLEQITEPFRQMNIEINYLCAVIMAYLMVISNLVISLGSFVTHIYHKMGKLSTRGGRICKLIIK